MGIGDNGILAVGADKTAVTLAMIGEMVDSDSELISVYYGEDIDEATAQALVEQINENFPGPDVELQPSGQPIYSYIISVE